MIIPVALFVGPSKLVSMLEAGVHDDPEIIARNHADTFEDVIYFMAELNIEGDNLEPDLDIQWMEFYGKQVTANMYMFVEIGFDGHGLAEPLRLQENELNWFLEAHPEANLFVYNER